jgi:hypothetical protein
LDKISDLQDVLKDFTIISTLYMKSWIFGPSWLWLFFIFHLRWYVMKNQGQSILRSWINWHFFVVAALLIKAKYQQWKNDNKNTGLFIYCMNFVVVCTKINIKNIVDFFSYAWALKKIKANLNQKLKFSYKERKWRWNLWGLLGGLKSYPIGLILFSTVW